MKYMKKGRKEMGLSIETSEDDPLSGVANLLDLGLVFIVALLITFFSAYHLQDLFNSKSEITIMRKARNGEMEIITKKGKKVRMLKVSKEKATGRGERLGVAYRLEDGTLVYVPDKE